MGDIVPISEIYDGLTTAQIDRVQKLTNEVRAGSRIATRAMLQIGVRLEEIKRILKQDKRWRQWCEVEFSASHDTADRYIRAAKRFASEMTVASALPKTVLYYLTDEAPPEVADVVLEHAKQGEKITLQVAEKIAATFQRAAVKVIEESIATNGAVSLNGQTVTIIDQVQTTIDAEGKQVVSGTVSKTVLNAAVSQAVNEIMKFDNESVRRHIVKVGQNKGRVSFLNWGSLSEFSTMMKSGITQKFNGEIRISVWGIPEAPKEQHE